MNELSPKPPTVYGAVKLNTTVAIGAQTTAATTVGNNCQGLTIKLGNCTLGVTTNCAMLAPIVFCLYDIAVKPTNCAVVPIAAAAAETGSSVKATAM